MFGSWRRWNDGSPIGGSLLAAAGEVRGTPVRDFPAIDRTAEKEAIR
jgi:hypothetical protein